MKENLSVLGAHQIVIPSSQDRLRRRRRTQRGVAHTGAHLDELDRPLDVREATGAQLDMARGLGAAGQALVLHAGFQQADVAYVRLTHSSVGELREELSRPIGELPLPNRTRAHRRLPLPRGSPALRVLAV